MRGSVGRVDSPAGLLVDDLQDIFQRDARRLGDELDERVSPLGAVAMTASPMLASVTRHFSGRKCNDQSSLNVRPIIAPHSFPSVTLNKSS